MQISTNYAPRIPTQRASQASSEAQDPAPQGDTFVPTAAPTIQVGLEKPAADKEVVIRSLIRTSPDEEATQKVIEALSAYPVQALKVVQEYGTKVEIYADGTTPPLYQPTLTDENVLGAYNTRANVLGVFKSSMSPFALIHEFAHALDAALGDPSQGPDWKNARLTAQYTHNAVRAYATYDEAEYMAENTVAYLVADDSLVPLVERGLANHIGQGTMTEREYWQMHQNYSHDRLQHLDPAGYALVDDVMTHRIFDGPKKPAKPAMSEQEWVNDLRAHKDELKAELRKRKAEREARLAKATPKKLPA